MANHNSVSAFVVISEGHEIDLTKFVSNVVISPAQVENSEIMNIKFTNVDATITCRWPSRKTRRRWKREAKAKKAVSNA